MSEIVIKVIVEKIDNMNSAIKYLNDEIDRQTSSVKDRVTERDELVLELEKLQRNK